VRRIDAGATRGITARDAHAVVCDVHQPPAISANERNVIEEAQVEDMAAGAPPEGLRRV
jgi:hypothetical protein